MLVLFYLFAQKSPFVYLTNDDVYLRMIASGEMGTEPSAHLYYVGILPGAIVSSLYRLFPQGPWYGLFLCVSFGVSLWVFLYALLKRVTSAVESVMALFFFFLLGIGFLFLHVAEIQFTTVTGMVGAGALFMFYMVEEKESCKEELLSYLPFFLLSIWAVSIRDNAFIMFLPFIGFLGLGKLWDSLPQKKLKPLLLAGGVFVLCLAGVMGLEKVAYSSDNWQAFSEYTDASEELYDYLGFPDYEENRDVYDKMGITPGAYAAIYDNYEILLHDQVGVHTFPELAALAKEQKAKNAPSFTEKLKEMGAFFLDRHLSYTDRPLNLLVYLLYIGIGVLAALGKKYKSLRDIVLILAGRMVIWTYLVYNGRLPSRVSQAIYLAELFLLLGVALKGELLFLRTAEKKQRIGLGIVLALVVLVSVRFGLPKADAAASESYSREQFSSAFTEMKVYMQEHSENFYFLDMNSFGNFTENIFREENRMDGNYLLMGSWVPHSPWYQEKLDKKGFQHPAGDALEKENGIYFVFMDSDPEKTEWDYLQAFYKEEFGNCKVKQEDVVYTENGLSFHVLKVRKKN